MYRIQPTSDRSGSDGKTFQLYILWNRSRFLKKRIQFLQRQTDSILTVCLIFISGQQVKIRVGTRFYVVENFDNRMNFGRFIEEILVLIDKKDSYIYDINNFLTNYHFLWFIFGKYFQFAVRTCDDL